MNAARGLLHASIVTMAVGLAHGAPDEDSLGKANGYPVAPRQALASQERYRVGSFSAMDSIAPHCKLDPSVDQLPLRQATSETGFSYRMDGQTRTLDDYMARQRVTSLLVLKDGEIVAERRNYDRKAGHRMLSNSMAKTIVALAIGKALEEGLIRSLDDTAAQYDPMLADTLYGNTRLINLLRMASGAKYVEDYSGQDDHARFNRTAARSGMVDAARAITERVAPEGSLFNYASAETNMLGLVLRGATRQTLCRYVSEKIWQPMGAESGASWLINPAGQTEYAAGSFNATVRDYARLGWLMANDGQRDGKPVVAKDWLLRMTDASQQPEGFRPGKLNNRGSTYLGYGLQTWLMPGTARRFVLLGIYGQAILVDPGLKLVVVHMAVAKNPTGNEAFARERDALFRGIVARYGSW